jgi:hypothetical protein
MYILERMENIISLTRNLPEWKTKGTVLIIEY